MKRLVADTGPVLHLYEAHALHLLPIIGQVFLSPLVMSEIRAHSPVLWPKRHPEWATLQTLSADSETRARQWQRAGLLHGGEAEALSLALEIEPDWLLTDDAAARLMAESLGIEVHGSVGVVLWSAASKLVGKAEAEACLDGLEHSSLWMSQRVRVHARAALVKCLAMG